MLLLDVMLAGHFVCQMRYNKRGFVVDLGNGNFEEAYDTEELRRFVEDKRPSLVGKDYKICFSNQKILCS